MTQDGSSRFSAALAGHVVDPPACGVTFLPLSAVTNRRGTDGVVSGLPRALEDGSFDFIFVPSWEPVAGELVEIAHSAGTAVAWVVRGALWPTLEEVGLGEGLRATLLDPGSLTAPLDSAVEDARVAIAAGAKLGVNAIVVADDLAGNEGPMVTLEYALAEVLPRLAAICAEAASMGLPAVLHSDGDVGRLYADLREAGFAAVHLTGMPDDSFERLFWKARASGLCALGGIMTSDLAMGLPAAVLAGTRAGILAQRGGLLLADDGGVTGFDEYAALLAAFAAARGPRV